MMMEEEKKENPTENHAENDPTEEGEEENMIEKIDTTPNMISKETPRKNEYWVTWRDVKDGGGGAGDTKLTDLRQRTKEMKMKQKMWNMERRNNYEEENLDDGGSRDQILTGPEEGGSPGWSNILLISPNPPARLGGRVGGGSGAHDEILACKESNAPHNAGPLPDLEGERPLQDDDEKSEYTEEEGNNFGLTGLTELCMKCVMIPCI